MPANLLLQAAVLAGVNMYRVLHATHKHCCYNVFRGLSHVCDDDSCELTHCIDSCTFAGHLVSSFQGGIHGCCTLEREDHTPNAAGRMTQHSSAQLVGM